MKRREVIKLLEDAGLRYLRPGGNHDLYWKPGIKQPVPVGRHRELTNFEVARILKEAGINQ
ncbi:hypothetical protein AGMMS49992_34290 [Clostridia bacterium]|nr:hypothetical protein AGMMS49992_34290 [Clostridia bacterium]